MTEPQLFFKRVSQAEVPRLTRSHQMGISVPKNVGERIMTPEVARLAGSSGTKLEIEMLFGEARREMEFIFYSSRGEYRLVYFPVSWMNECSPGDILLFTLVDGGRRPVIRCARIPEGTDDHRHLTEKYPESPGEILEEGAIKKMKWSEDVRRDLEWRPRLMQIAVTGMIETALEMRKTYFPSLQSVRQELLERMEGDVFSVSDSKSHDVWKHWSDKPLSFLDGGVGRIDFLGHEPILIRVGVFTVRLDESDLSKREDFQFYPILFGDIYRSAGEYDRELEDRKREAARMIAEIAAAYRFLQLNRNPGVLLVHGPLVNTLSPYVASEKGIPMFVPDIWERLVGRDLPCTLTDPDKRLNFVPLYEHFLNGVAGSESLVAGVVERSGSREYVRGKLGASRYERYRSFNFSDAFILSLILEPGQHTAFAHTNKNDPSKAAPRWKASIQSMPPISYCYLQVNSEYPPFRVEIPTEYSQDQDLVHLLMAYIHSCAKILSRYAFPVGLDVIDKYAKIPDWMSSAAMKIARQALYREVLHTRDDNEMNTVLKILSLQSRDFFFRPKV